MLELRLDWVPLWAVGFAGRVGSQGNLSAVARCQAELPRVCGAVICCRRALDMCDLGVLMFEGTKRKRTPKRKREANRKAKGKGNQKVLKGRRDNGWGEGLWASLDTALEKGGTQQGLRSGAPRGSNLEDVGCCFNSMLTPY